MSRILGIIFLTMIPEIISAQNTEFAKTASGYFAEIKMAAEHNNDLWNINLYAPIMLVDPKTRQIYTNVSDSGGTLKKYDDVYLGALPDVVNIANTSLHWSGTHWAMIMLPLPENKQERINLLGHELFHRTQNALGFRAHNPDNPHLDKKEGRIYLRLELEALKKAVTTSSSNETKKYITDAMIFRKYRHQLYPGADSTENLLELNEGIAEFTGAMLSGRNEKEMQEHFSKAIDRFILNPTYVRSFAYQTVPAYGYLLNVIERNWQKRITPQTGLSRFFESAFKLRLSAISETEVKTIGTSYGLSRITEEENIRGEKAKKQIRDYLQKLVEQPHLELPLQNMNMSFDPRNIVPLEDKGTVYPKIRITDNWGILDVTGGALINPNWKKISLSFPLTIEPQKVTGDGWSLELKEGYILDKDGAGNMILKKK